MRPRIDAVPSTCIADGAGFRIELHRGLPATLRPPRCFATELHDLVEGNRGDLRRIQEPVVSLHGHTGTAEPSGFPWARWESNPRPSDQKSVLGVFIGLHYCGKTSSERGVCDHCCSLLFIVLRQPRGPHADHHWRWSALAGVQPTVIRAGAKACDDSCQPCYRMKIASAARARSRWFGARSCQVSCWGSVISLRARRRRRSLGVIRVARSSGCSTRNSRKARSRRWASGVSSTSTATALAMMAPRSEGRGT